MPVTHPSPLSTAQQPSLKQSPQIVLQNAIVTGDVGTIATLIDLNVSILETLPNGELPLHFAVREDQPEVVTLLLEKGADPSVRDFQNLSAVDHAALVKNKGMLARILSHKIGSDLKTTQAQIQRVGTPQHVAQLKERIKHTLAIDPSTLNPISKKVVEGEVLLLSDDVIRSNINDLDASKLTPIHYAILTRNAPAVHKLINLGARTDILSPNGETLLHFAAMAGLHNVVDLLVARGIDPNTRNSYGETALHHAAAIGDLACVEALAKSKADPNIIDTGGMSPLALIGSDANERDPLQRSTLPLVLCGITALQLLSPAMLSSEWMAGLISGDTKESVEFVLNGAELLASYVVEGNELQTLAVGAFTMYFFGWRSLEDFSWLFFAPRIFNTAKVALASFRNCWRNWRYRKWDSLCSVAVPSLNLYRSIDLLFSKGSYSFTPKNSTERISHKKVTELASKGIESRLSYGGANMTRAVPAIAALCPACLQSATSGNLPDAGKIRYAYWEACAVLKEKTQFLSLFSCPKALTIPVAKAVKNLNVIGKTLNSAYWPNIDLSLPSCKVA